MIDGVLVATFGCWSVYRGKLSSNDSRAAYVCGPTITGRQGAPIASFWSVDDAIAWAKRRAELG